MCGAVGTARPQRRPLGFSFTFCLVNRSAQLPASLHAHRPGRSPVTRGNSVQLAQCRYGTEPQERRTGHERTGSEERAARVRALPAPTAVFHARVRLTRTSWGALRNSRRCPAGSPCVPGRCGTRGRPHRATAGPGESLGGWIDQLDVGQNAPWTVLRGSPVSPQRPLTRCGETVCAGCSPTGAVPTRGRRGRRGLTTPATGRPRDRLVPFGGGCHGVPSPHAVDVRGLRVGGVVS
jgi:hypothetical protein